MGASLTLALPCDAGGVDDAAEVVAAARERASALADGDTERLTALLHAEFHWT